MNFRTELHIEAQEPKIELNSQLFSIGSCFSESIGQKLLLNKFKLLCNPFGVLFNPLSIVKLLELTIDGGQIDQQHFVEHEGIWKHYDFHSQYNAKSKKQLESQLANVLQEVANWLKNTDIIIVTLGTAWVHELNTTNKIVANCHKQPKVLFSKRLLDLEEIHQAFDRLLAKLPKSTRIILTVSPIRHLKENLSFNQVSKSLLRLYCHQSIQKHEIASYFPSYELLLDDLRDYRFYTDDLIHPTDFAINYIWEKFQFAHFSEASQQFIKDWQKLSQALNHKALQPDSAAHKRFLKTLLSKLDAISIVNVEAEKAKVRQDLDL